MKEERCIRILADVSQIEQCRRDIIRIDETVNRLSRALNLAGNAVRMKILFLLHKEGEMCPCDLSDVLRMKVPAISQHLRKMKDAGLVISKKVGQTIFYSVEKTEAQILTPILDQLIEMNKKEETVLK